MGPSIKKTLIKDTALYSLANYFAMALGIVVSIIAKALLGAAGAGQWALIKVFCSYGEYSDLGTRNAMLREMAQSSGSGDKEKSLLVRDSSFSFMSLMACVSATIIFFSAFFKVQDPVLRKGLFVASLLVIATQGYNFYLCLLRTLKKITALSSLVVLNMVFVTLFSLLGCWMARVIGFALGTFFATAISAFLGYKFSGSAVLWKWDSKEIIRLLKIGVPTVLISYALVTFLSLDSVMIGKMIGLKELGYYTIGLMAVQQVSTIGRFTQIILMPYIQEHYGKSKQIKESRHYFLRITRVLVFVLPVIIAGVIFLLPCVVHYLLPKFLPGIFSMKILVLGYFFVVVNEMSSTILFTMNKQGRLIPILLGLVLMAFALNYGFIRKGWGIEGVAIATGMTYFFYFIFLFVFAFREILTGFELFKTIILVIFIFLYFSSMIFFLDQHIHIRAVLMEGIIKCGVFIFLFLPFLVYLEKKEGLLGIIADLLHKKGALA